MYDGRPDPLGPERVDRPNPEWAVRKSNCRIGLELKLMTENHGRLSIESHDRSCRAPLARGAEKTGEKSPG